MSPPPMNKLSSLTKKQTPIYIKYTLRSTLLFSPPKKKSKNIPMTFIHLRHHHPYRHRRSRKKINRRKKKGQCQKRCWLQKKIINNRERHTTRHANACHESSPRHKQAFGTICFLPHPKRIILLTILKYLSS